jgi:lysophospholipase L1-like esterase
VEALRAVRPDFEFVNLGERYLTTAEIRRTQLARAIELEPDLVTVVAGGNDLLKENFDPKITEDEFDAMVEALLAAGPTVMTFTMLDIFSAGVMAKQLDDMLAPRFEQLNEAVRKVAARRGVLVVDLTSHPASRDPGIYSKDLQHANMRGHAIAAELILGGLAELAATVPLSS